MSSRSIFLEFGPEIDGVVAARMTYVIQVFCAIYGYAVAPHPEAAEARCYYGSHPRTRPKLNEIWIPARYAPQVFTGKVPNLQRHRHANEDFFLAHGLDGTSGNPDWLGEIFEWLSASFEQGIVERDLEGRIPYSACIFHGQEITPFKPYAGLLMAWLENAIQGNSRTESLAKAESPLPGVEHAVICSHDIDFYYTHTTDVLKRLGKNIVISMTSYRSPSFLFSNLGMAAGLLGGKRTGDYVPRMVDAIESEGFQSTLFAVAGGNHRRDPNYRVEEIGPQLRGAAARGFGVAVHASYESLSGPGRVKDESGKLGCVVHQAPLGSRQHWLRFGEHKSLYREIQTAGLAYDSSLGFSETCGFRNGANFAFPPYDFEKERACSFLEIPLVIMDGSLLHASRTLREDPQTMADRILAESRKAGWGGISILWHNPMEPVQVPQEINNVFWRCAGKRREHGEEWMSAEAFLKASLPRYHRAGLLREIHLDA